MSGLDHGEDVAMMNLRRAAAFVVVLAFAAMAQDYSLSGTFVPPYDRQ